MVSVCPTSGAVIDGDGIPCYETGRSDTGSQAKWLMGLTTVLMNVFSCYLRSSASCLFSPIRRSWCGAYGTCLFSSLISKIPWIHSLVSCTCYRGPNSDNWRVDKWISGWMDGWTHERMDGRIGWVTWYFYFRNCLWKMSFGQYYFNFNFKNVNV